MIEKEKGDGKIPTIFVSERSIPEAYWEAIKAVHEKGYVLRTQYDRKNDVGEYIDPAGRDTRASVEILDPFAEPRFPPLSFCERGKYIAEFLGAKDHLVVPYDKLKAMVKHGVEFSATEWPYCYHQRLAAYPTENREINQLEVILEKIAKDPITRRAVAVTPVPEIDLFMKEDQPCLREIQLRAIENSEGDLVLNMSAFWRSRDLYKAWGDNLIGISNLHRYSTERLAEKMGRRVVIGPYSEFNGSLHIYGQDYSEKGADKFFETFPTKQSFVERSMTSEMAVYMIVDELETLRKEETWRFGSEQLGVIDKLISDFSSGRIMP